MKYLRVFMVIFFSCLFFVFGSVKTPKEKSTGVVQTLTVEEKINDFVKSLTVEEMIGQTLMVGFRDSKTRSFKNANAGLKYFINKYKIGNVILYKDNFNPKLKDEREIRKSVFNLTRGFQEAAFNSQENNKKIPLLIAVDQEGGEKVRLEKGVTQVPDPMYIGVTRSEQHAYYAGWIIGSEMKALGFNMILAPVADINSNTRETVIGRRSFGANKAIVAPLCVQFMKGIKETGILSVGKHFPGHGNTVNDPHFECLPRLMYKDRSQLDNWDLVPFKNLIDNGVDGIITAHLLATPIDKILPVTISEKANKAILRKELKFKGLIIADDLSVMKAILRDKDCKKARTIEEASKRAYDAGNDIIIYGWIEQEEPVGPIGGISLKKFEGIYETIKNYLKNDEEHWKELSESVKRIITAKSRIVKFENFNDLDSWQSSYYNDEEFLKLKNKNEKTSETIARDSMVVISESGDLCNDMSESLFFRDKKGPLNCDKLFKGFSDKILLVSPVFERDELSEAILKHAKKLVANENIETIKLLWMRYVWYEKEQLDDASKIWSVELKPWAKTNSSGRLEFDQPLIEEKAKEIKEKARDKRFIVFGAAERGHIEILKSLLGVNKKENENEIKIDNTPILVLLFIEPYLLPIEIYEKKNVSVFFLPSIPNMRLAAHLLDGNIQPKSVKNIPLSIPGLIIRSTSMGASIIPKGTSKGVPEPPPTKPIPPILWSLLSGLIGAGLFFVIPRGRLKWVKGNKSQYNWTDLLWTLMVGLVAAVIVYCLSSILIEWNIWGLKVDVNKGNPLSRYIITGILSLLSPALWLRFIRGISS